VNVIVHFIVDCTAWAPGAATAAMGANINANHNAFLVMTCSSSFP
jgi:hypothetical protein